MTWILYAVISAIFAALVTIFGKIGVQGVDSTLATSVRAVIMAVFLVGTSLALGKFSLLSSLSGKPFYFIVLSGIAGALSWLFYFFALKHGPASVVAVLDRLSVVFIFILAALFLGEAVTGKSLIGISMIVVGAVLMIR